MSDPRVHGRRGVAEPTFLGRVTGGPGPHDTGVHESHGDHRDDGRPHLRLWRHRASLRGSGAPRPARSTDAAGRSSGPGSTRILRAEQYAPTARPPSIASALAMFHVDQRGGTWVTI